MSAKSDFWAGFTQPSMLASMVGGVIALLGPLYATQVLTPDFIRDHPDRACTEAHDDNAFLTSRVLALQDHDPKVPVVAVLGASSIREAVSSQKALDEAVDQAKVYVLGAGEQSLWESAAILDVIPPESQGLAVIAVSTLRLSTPTHKLGAARTQPRLGIRSEVLDGYTRDAGYWVLPRTNIYALDNPAFVLPRLYRPLYSQVHGPTPWHVHYFYEGRQKVPITAYTEYFDYIAAVTPDTVNANLEALADGIRIAQDRGLKAMILLTPSEPGYYPNDQLRKVHQRLRQRTITWADDQGVALVDLHTELNLDEDDFADWTHLRRQAAMDRFTEALAGHIRRGLDE